MFSFISSYRSSHQRFALKQLFLKISQYSQENTTCNFIKKRLQYRCFPVNIAKFLWTSILNNICERLLLQVEMSKFKISQILLKFMKFVLAVKMNTFEDIQNCYTESFCSIFSIGPVKLFERTVFLLFYCFPVSLQHNTMKRCLWENSCSKSTIKTLKHCLKTFF